MINITYVTHKSKIDDDGQVPIFMRLTLKGRRTEISLKKKVKLTSWCKNSQSVKKSDPQSNSTNNLMLLQKTEALKCYNQLLSLGEKFDISDVRKRLLGESTYKTLLYACDFHNEQMKSLIGTEFAESTYVKYLTTKSKVKAFIKAEYGKDDILLPQVNNAFLESFLHYLKVKDKQMVSTASKYVKNLKKIIRLAKKHNWIQDVPDVKLSNKGEKTNIKYLTAEELAKIEEKHFSIDRLEIVKDVFLFCCYTGLAYSDVEKVTTDNLITTIDGTLAIEVNRTKTNNRCYIPLIPQALHLIDKYAESADRLIKHKLLPVRSNQRTNAYLKEIADLCGIKKNLTHHYARFTFATTVTLANDIPITDVAYMMGHKNLKTTQLYASVVDKNVTKSMASLGEKMSSKTSQNVKNRQLKKQVNS